MKNAGLRHSRIGVYLAIFVVMLFITACSWRDSGSSGGNVQPESETANLSNLILSSGVLNPGFDMDTADYTVSIPSSVEGISFTPYAAEPSSVITVKGRDVASGIATELIHMDYGLNTVPVVVNAEDGSAKTYNVVVTRFTPGLWTWVAGDTSPDQAGVYGTMGETSTANKPGGRRLSLSWTDGNGAFWLFGGLGIDREGGSGDLSDLWKFDGAAWTWMSGDSLADQPVVYGARGVTSPVIKPGAREGVVGWTGGEGSLWLYGGWGLDAAGTKGPLGDLWKFDGENWTWMSGETLVGRNAVYGGKGIAADSNTPGNRAYGISWKDKEGNFWLFGGLTVNGGLLNDLWKFDGSRWTWVSGDSSTNQKGVYGAMGIAADANKPGARYSGVSWIDRNGALWLFGGWGYDGAGTRSHLDDLWKFDGTRWTWVSGDTTANHCGVYGIKGTPAPGNKPGSRRYSVSWTDRAGNLWLFGGWGMDGNTYLEYIRDFSGGQLNDLWRFDGTNWTWISGSDTMNSSGAYGVMGDPSLFYTPGARYGSTGWVDRSGFLWLFGGLVYDRAGDYNDLWKVTP
jgi:hypothetical protein